MTDLNFRGLLLVNLLPGKFRSVLLSTENYFPDETIILLEKAVFIQLLEAVHISFMEVTEKRESKET